MKQLQAQAVVIWNVGSEKGVAGLDSGSMQIGRDASPKRIRRTSLFSQAPS
ncbi:MAG TPA: hypothetical protein VKD89_10465 [Candidatus Udaeobacter sp.]|nr:hypothetical protein [Candidatus Udaeobacter sp.]